ncbi:MAG: hypothetical protein Q9227_000425 [Pyrenula ochraceoflavens]
MGGSAFKEDNLSTPRMPSSIYYATRDAITKILLDSFYSKAETPIEAPEKPDHGDIDILVSSPRKEFQIEDIASAIGATKFKKVGLSNHFAIPWPESIKDVSESSVTDEHNGVVKPQKNDECFIQVDISPFADPLKYHWALFHHAHGDFWNILGVLIRRYGLTASYSGVYLRIAEVETHNKNAARVLLTSDSRKCLEFLGVDYDRFWKPFATKRELFEYVATCRFYDPTRFADSDDLKANDKKRARKRNLFSEWVDDYLPTVRDGKKGEWAAKSRDEMREVAKEWFGIGEEFERRRTSFLKRLAGERLWTDIRKSLPLEGSPVGIAMKGLKREIAGSADLSDDMKKSQCEEVRKSYREGDYDAVKAWTLAHWEEAHRRQAEIEKVNCAKYFQGKAAKELGQSEPKDKETCAVAEVDRGIAIE